MKNPNFSETLEELDAGVFLNKISRALADVALGVVEHNKAGKVTLTLDLKRIGESSQVSLSHKIKYEKPTRRGKSSEEDTTETPMYVNRNGYLSVAPDTQLDLFKLQNEEKTHG